MKPIIELKNVSLVRSEQLILDRINWTVGQAAARRFLVDNGSGKSTIARIVACHLLAHGGTSCGIRPGIWSGESAGTAASDPTRAASRTLRHRSIVDRPSGVPLTGFFGTLNLYDAVEPAMINAADDQLRRFGLPHLAEHSYATLSSGEKVVVLLARAMVSRPRLLLLDEPTAGLDVLAREQVLATIQSLAGELSIVIITHHVEELPPATSNVLLLRQGKVVAAGLPAEVLTDPVLTEAYNCPVQVRRSNGRYYVEVSPGFPGPRCYNRRAANLIEKQVLYDGKKVRLEIHHLQDEEGKRYKREVVVHPGAVVILAFVTPERILMLRQKRYAIGQILVELPAGTLEKGEIPMNCAGRELREETGYLASKLKLIGTFFSSPGILSEKMYAYAAYDLRKSTQELDEGEELEVVEMDFGGSSKDVRAGARFRMRKTIATLLMYRRKAMPVMMNARMPEWNTNVNGLQAAFITGILETHQLATGIRMAWQDRAYNRDQGSDGAMRMGFPTPTPWALGVIGACIAVFILQCTILPQVTDWGSFIFAGGLARKEPWRWINLSIPTWQAAHIFSENPCSGIYFFLPPLERLWGVMAGHWSLHTRRHRGMGFTFGIISVFFPHLDSLIGRQRGDHGVHGRRSAAVSRDGDLADYHRTADPRRGCHVRRLVRADGRWPVMIYRPAAHLGGLVFGFIGASLYRGPSLWRNFIGSMEQTTRGPADEPGAGR